MALLSRYKMGQLLGKRIVPSTRGRLKGVWNRRRFSGRTLAPGIVPC